MCKLNYVILPVALHASIGTLMAITVDRCRGLVAPFAWRADSLSKAKISVPIIWAISLILSSPLFKYSEMVEVTGEHYCGEMWPSPSAFRWFWTSNFILVFAIPLVVIVTTQVIMVVAVAKKTSNRKQNKRMMTMVVALVVVFTICTGFQHFFFLISEFGSLHIDISTKATLYALSNCVVSLQAAVNPVIYGTLRRDFKKAFTHSLVVVLIKLKLHKGILYDANSDTTSNVKISSTNGISRRRSFASKVLTSYFSESHTRKHTDREVKEVEEMFKQKKLEEERVVRESFYSSTSCPGTPRLGSPRSAHHSQGLNTNTLDVIATEDNNQQSPLRKKQHHFQSIKDEDGFDSPRMGRARRNLLRRESLSPQIGRKRDGSLTVKHDPADIFGDNDSPIITNKRVYGQHLSPEHASRSSFYPFDKMKLQTISGSVPVESIMELPKESTSNVTSIGYDKKYPKETPTKICKQKELTNFKRTPGDFITTTEQQSPPSTHLALKTQFLHVFAANDDVFNVDSPRVSRDFSQEAVDSQQASSPQASRKASVISIGGKRFYRKNSIFNNGTINTENSENPDRVQLLSYKDSSGIEIVHKTLIQTPSASPFVMRRESSALENHPSPALSRTYSNNKTNKNTTKYSNKLSSTSDTGYVSGSDQDDVIVNGDAIINTNGQIQKTSNSESCMAFPSTHTHLCYADETVL